MYICVCTVCHLDRVGQRNGNSQWQPFRNSHHQHRHTDDEELYKVLDVDRGALGEPWTTLDPKGVNYKVKDQDDDCHGRHDQTCMDTQGWSQQWAVNILTGFGGTSKWFS